MCYFISLIVKGGSADTIDTVLRKFGRKASPASNPSVAGLLAQGENQYITTADHCDCGTVLVPVSSRPEKDDSELIKKFRRRGWSNAKIERWVADRQKSELSSTVRRQELSPDSHEMWRKIVLQLLASKAVESVSLLIHFYSGSVQTENFEISRVYTSIADMNHKIATFPEDTIVTFAAG